jgi:hypothetical protein
MRKSRARRHAGKNSVFSTAGTAVENTLSFVPFTRFGHIHGTQIPPASSCRRYPMHHELELELEAMRKAPVSHNFATKTFRT